MLADLMTDQIRAHLAELHNMCTKVEVDEDINSFMGSYMDKITQMQIQNLGALYGMLAITKSPDFAQTVLENYLAHFRNAAYERIEETKQVVAQTRADVEAANSTNDAA